MENSTDDIWIPDMLPCPNFVVCLMEVMVIILVAFVILIGNTVNLILLISTPALRNCHGYLLMSLSTADLLTGLMASFAVYPSATLRSRTDSWPYGDTACLVTAYLNQVGITNSAGNLMLLSLERYVAVVYPLRYSRIVTKKSTFICIVFAWLFSAAFLSSIFTGHPRHFYFSSLYVCLPLLFSAPIYAWVMFGIVLTPILIIVGTSCIVSKTLHPRPRQGPGVILAPSESRTSIKVRTFRMVQVMTATFMLSYVPFFVVLLLTIVWRVSMPQLVTFGVYWLLITNSFFNTVIYFRMNMTIHKRLSEMFKLVEARVSLNTGGENGCPSVSLNTVHSNNQQDGDRKTSTTVSSINVQCEDSVL